MNERIVSNAMREPLLKIDSLNMAGWFKKNIWFNEYRSTEWKEIKKKVDLLYLLLNI